ncbi:MAG: sugar phosphate nucleotidyltransferase [Actinomycetota bacterium]
MTQPDPSEIPVVILCGGQGTRIREASEKLPKPLIDIGGRPILWHIMKLYGAHGYRRFFLCLGYKAWDIKQYFLEYEHRMSDLRVTVGSPEPEYIRRESIDDWEVSLLDTGMDTGTGGRLAHAGELVDTDYFMVTYGDGLGNIDLHRQLEELHASEHLGGMVTGVHPSSRYGELEVADDMVITDFAEKPPSQGWVSGGFFAFRRDFLTYLSDDPLHFFEHKPVQDLTREKRLGLFPHDGFWMGMDTFREYTALNEMWARDEAPWKLW